jgi:hypothetical protein
MSEKEPGRAKSSQEESGATRRSQEEPGEASRSQELVTSLAQIVWKARTDQEEPE